MIICEEKAFEKILSLGFCDTAIPISVRQEPGCEAEITVLPSLKKVAQKFEKEYMGKYFAPEAHEFLRREVRPFMDSIGYHDNRQSRKISVIMTMRENLRSTKTDAVILASATDNKTTADIDSLIEFGHVVAAKIVDGSVVACAYTDLNPDGCKFVEIGVETAPEYRRRGYAKSTLQALITKLNELGIIPVYITSVNNKASLTLAKSLGFEADAFEYNYVFRRK